MTATRPNLKTFSLVLTLTLLFVRVACAGRVVEAAAKPDKEWKPYPTRTLEDLPSGVGTQTNPSLTRFGGLVKERLKATGFFRTEKINGRWYLIDPAGGQFISIGLSSVNTVRTPGAEAAVTRKFGTVSNWAEQVGATLRSAGFNTLGAWSDDETLGKVVQRTPYTKLANFMSAYGKKRGGTFQQPGHTGYPGDCIFVFDPGFEAFCTENAKQLAAYRNDPWLIGYFSDNEMPFKQEALKNYLKLPTTDPGYQAALAWLKSRQGSNATTNDITAHDEKDFLGVVVARYFSVVSRAIKKADPNHLYLGSRFYGTDKVTSELFKMAGPFVDVLSVNYYNAWTPEAEHMAMWLRESGKPFLVTEWYAKGVDSGLANTGGAGWLVKTQRERGLYYQNFALGLLESPGCVGWCWLKYTDNDPDDKRADPSNRDSNKGIVNNRYEPYTPLIEKMTELNRSVYAVAEHFSTLPGKTTAANHTK